MIERDPKIVKSGLSRTVKKDGVTVEVSNIRLEHETEWSLEVVNSATARLPWGGDSTIIPPSNAPTRSSRIRIMSGRRSTRRDDRNYAG